MPNIHPACLDRRCASKLCWRSRPFSSGGEPLHGDGGEEPPSSCGIAGAAGIAPPRRLIASNRVGRASGAGRPTPRAAQAPRGCPLFQAPPFSSVRQCEVMVQAGSAPRVRSRVGALWRLSLALPGCTSMRHRSLQKCKGGCEASIANRIVNRWSAVTPTPRLWSICCLQPDAGRRVGMP